MEYDELEEDLEAVVDDDMDDRDREVELLVVVDGE